MGTPGTPHDLAPASLALLGTPEQEHVEHLGSPSPPLWERVTSFSPEELGPRWEPMAEEGGCVRVWGRL